MITAKIELDEEEQRRGDEARKFLAQYYADRGAGRLPSQQAAINFEPSRFNLPDWAVGDTFGANALRTIGKIGTDYSTLLGIDNPKIQALAQALDEESERSANLSRSPERIAEREALNAQAAQAQGFTQNAKAAIDNLTDLVTHPSEWRAGNIVGALADPMNMVGFGGGALAAKLGKTALTKIAIAGATGAASEATIGGGFETALALREGESFDAAMRRGTQAAVASAILGDFC
jgi:hypothetical protein